MSYCEMLHKEDISASAPRLSRVARATVFISHAWQYRFVDLVSALRHYFGKTHELRTVVIWLDVLSHNQHMGLDFDEWCDGFFAAIEGFSRTVMVLNPWDNPITLNRSWCLLELYITIKSGATFDVAFLPTEEARFLRELVSGYEVFNQVLASVDVANSEAEKPEDKQKIIEKVRSGVGIGAVNKMVFDRMRAWVIYAAQAELERTAKLRGQEHLDTIACAQRLGVLLCHQGKYSDAEPLLIRCVNKKMRVLGDSDDSTLSSVHMLALLYIEQNRFEDALPLCELREMKLRQRLGDDDLNTISAISTLASCYSKLDRLSEAEELQLLCLRKLDKKLGDNHPDTLGAVLNLAITYFRQDKPDSAEPMLFLCVLKMKQVLGESDRRTLIAIRDLALVYCVQGKRSAAEPLFATYEEKIKQVCGDNHPDANLDMQILLSSADRLRNLQRFFSQLPRSGSE
eukprot:c19518_g1_i2.p1 GENE.c19518_g1_i2~~c19518_g1_i2.p1  ORF type:complete len:457 (-),score=65.86 c19518_g1_i2:77-1447(-)